MSRHRGVKPSGQYELSRTINLLSPAYLLSINRRLFHDIPPGHYALLTYLMDLLVTQLSLLKPLHLINHIMVFSVSIRFMQTFKIVNFIC